MHRAERGVNGVGRAVTGTDPTGMSPPGDVFDRYRKVTL